MNYIKFIFFLMLSLSGSITAHAQGTMLTNEQTTKYYNNCIARAASDPNMFKSTKQTYCQCTALYTQKFISLEDIAASTGTDQAARDAINKTLINVHAPCMQYPVNDLIYKRCMADLGRNNICACVGSKMSAFTARESQRLLGDILKNNPNITDPMNEVINTKEFMTSQEQITFSCLKNPTGQ